MLTKAKRDWEQVERRIELDGDIAMVMVVEALKYCANDPGFAKRFGSLGAEICHNLTVSNTAL